MTAPIPPRDGFALGGTEVAPGKRADIELPLAKLPHGATGTVPCTVVHGRRAGPRLWLSGAVHGDELTGIEVIRRVLQQTKPASLRGTLVCVPMVNIFGVTSGSRYLPDRRDLNRSFPGSDKGSLAGRLAQLLITEVIERCDFGVDIHSGSDHRHNLPQIRAGLSDARTAELAAAFGAPIMIDAHERSGSLRGEAAARGRAVLLYEGGPPHRYDEEAIAVGVHGVLRVMKHLSMITKAPAPATPSLRSSRSRWSRAARGGLFLRTAPLGARVTQGEEVGRVVDAFGAVTARVKARVDGVIVGMRINPVVFQGDALVHVAEIDPAPGAPPPGEAAPAS